MSREHSARYSYFITIFSQILNNRVNYVQKGGVLMQDILKEYGPALITVIAIIALVAVVTFLIGSGGDGVVGKEFSSLITTFFEKANGGV